MATFKNFEELEIWQLARTLNRNIYPVLNYLQEKKSFELCRQLDRSLGSLMDNIAEGFEREGTKEFIQFLSVSKASAAEARSQLTRALDRNLVSKEEFDKFSSDCVLIADKIGRFINYLRNSGMKGAKYFPPPINNK